MKRLRTIVLVFALMTGISLAMAPVSVLAITCDTTAQKARPACQINSGVEKTGTAKTCTNGTGADKVEVDCMTQTITNITNVMLFIIGALSVVMIIVGGIRYVTSTGDSSRVKAAKDTIMYSVVGLLVALFAYAIVNFVITKLG